MLAIFFFSLLHKLHGLEYMQTLKWQDQNNLHHTGDRRQRQMSDIVTSGLFGESEALSGAGRWWPAAEGGWRHILVAWSSMQCFGKLWGSLVSLSSPKTTHCTGQTAPCRIKTNKNTKAYFVHVWYKYPGQTGKQHSPINLSSLIFLLWFGTFPWGLAFFFWFSLCGQSHTLLLLLLMGFIALKWSAHSWFQYRFLSGLTHHRSHSS